MPEPKSLSALALDLFLDRLLDLEFIKPDFLIRCLDLPTSVIILVHDSFLVAYFKTFGPRDRLHYSYMEHYHPDMLPWRP